MIGPRRGPGVKKKFPKTSILLCEVIMEPPKHIFESGFFFHVLARCEMVPFFKVEVFEIRIRKVLSLKSIYTMLLFIPSLYVQL